MAVRGSCLVRRRVAPTMAEFVVLRHTGPSGSTASSHRARPRMPSLPLRRSRRRPRLSAWLCGLTVLALTGAAEPPPGGVAANAVPIPALQGRTDASAFTGRRVTTRGIVTAALPGLRGFTLQDDAGDGDEATSDGLFVYNGQEDVTVEVGERIEISGMVK